MDIYLVIQRSSQDTGNAREKIFAELECALKKENCRDICMVSSSCMRFSGPRVPVFTFNVENSIYCKRLFFVHSGQILFIDTEDNIKILARIKLQWRLWCVFAFFVLSLPLVSGRMFLPRIVLFACGLLLVSLAPILLFTGFWVKRIIKKAVKSSGYEI
jgi:hypothetical protein